ncbi:hypothetical protein L2E82_07308 [Cichorium intybus]|uniref:Uncharacterized protein n=1 Tax=Cichorium intybus TaxID=13427 RepID=A0ACB9G453_CICIN|nr:hypothetical protein L2E82_07308 [Cichorium intybus]
MSHQIGSKCYRFFSPSNFMQFGKDELGRIPILPFFYLYVMRTEMEAYIRGLIPNFAQFCDMPAEFVQVYCHIAAHKFYFFCDPSRRGPFNVHLRSIILFTGKACIKKILPGNCLQELMELHQESEGDIDTENTDNRYSNQK